MSLDGLSRVVELAKNIAEVFGVEDVSKDDEGEEGKKVVRRGTGLSEEGRGPGRLRGERCLHLLGN